MSILALTLVSACGTPGQNYSADSPYDPLEKTNRKMYKVNLAIDKHVYRPVARTYADIVPDDIETMVSRFSDNAAMPSYMVNDVLQGDVYTAGLDLSRFVVNTTIGLGGFFDPATELGLAPASEADFARVLNKWGFSEGAYLVNPVLGPTTVRDLSSRIVGIFTNPVRYLAPAPIPLAVTGSNISSQLSDRARYGDTIDSILYDSTDSYKQVRQLYLQKRQYDIVGEADKDYLDPYGDAPAGTTSTETTYKDPYNE